MSEIRCDQVLAELDLFLDSELSEEECERILRHLEDCGGCSGREQFRRSVRDLIRRKCQTVDVPPGLQDRILRAIGSRSS